MCRTVMNSGRWVVRFVQSSVELKEVGAEVGYVSFAGIAIPVSFAVTC
jgi:hypothetical protein